MSSKKVVNSGFSKIEFSINKFGSPVWYERQEEFFSHRKVFSSFSKCTQGKGNHSKETKHQAQEINEIQGS